MDFFKGREGMKDAVNKAVKGGNYFKLAEPGDQTYIRFLDDLDEMAQFERHEFFGTDIPALICIGQDECPLCQVGHRPRYRFMANVLDRSTGDVKILSKGMELANEAILPYEAKFGTLTDRDYLVTAANRTRGRTTYIALNVAPSDKNVRALNAEEKKLTKVDWKVLLVVPKLKVLEQTAERWSNEQKAKEAGN